MQPIVTIFCAFTRQWAVQAWLDNLLNMEHDPSRTNLCIIVDGDMHLIANSIGGFAERHGYRSFHVKINEDWHANEVRLSVRRMRVADVHNQSKDLIAKTDGEFILGLEDDTVFDRDPYFLLKLLRPFDDNQVGFVEGVQMGRWGANIIGAWEADNAASPTKIKTLLPPINPNETPRSYTVDGIHYQNISGGGWYGYVTRRYLYLNCEYYTSTAQPWGPDVNYGLWLHQREYKCLIDWRVIFGHNDVGKILYPDDPKVRLTQVIYNKNTATGKWDRSDHEQDRY